MPAFERFKISFFSKMTFLLKISVVLSLILLMDNCDTGNINGLSVRKQASNPMSKNTLVDPSSYLPTLRFDGTDWWDTGEQNFPQGFVFNTTQDGNGDGVIDTDDALENLVRFKIGDNIYGTGRTGLPGRGPNDQRPAVYFHVASNTSYTVYEYWLYYADNDWINDHEHDWEKYFIYFFNGIPKYIKVGWHNDFNTYSWDSFPKDDGHPMLKVDGGSHAMSDGDEDGVQIRYNGEITKRGGRLDSGDGQVFKWVMYSNDSNTLNTVSYMESPNVFNGGDPEYSTNSDEYGGGIDAPWVRDIWNNPPDP